VLVVMIAAAVAIGSRAVIGRRHHLTQFYIRDLLVIILLVAFGCAYVANCVHERATESRLADEITAATNGEASFEWAVQIPSCLSFLASDADDSIFNRVVACSVPGRCIPMLRGLRYVKLLRITDNVTRGQLTQLDGLPELEALYLSQVNVFDDDTDSTSD